MLSRIGCEYRPNDIVVSDRAFDQSVPDCSDVTSWNAASLRLLLGILDYLGLARFVAHGVTRLFDPRGGAHIAVAALEQSDQLAVGGIDAGAHFGHRAAIFGKLVFAHGDAPCPA